MGTALVPGRSYSSLQGQTYSEISAHKCDCEETNNNDGIESKSAEKQYDKYWRRLRVYAMIRVFGLELIKAVAYPFFFFFCFVFFFVCTEK